MPEHKFEPIKSISVAKIRTQADYVMSHMVVKTEFGKIVGVTNPLAAVSDYLDVNKNKFFSKGSFTQEQYDALKAYELISAPLEKDGRKGMDYASVKVDGGGNRGAQENVMLAKQAAIHKLTDIHEYIDNNVINSDTGKPFSHSEMAYSHVFKRIYEGFWYDEGCEQIIRNIGRSGRNPYIDRTELQNGALMIAATAGGLVNYFRRNQEIKERGHKFKSIGEMNSAEYGV
jgi:hypothetical protein